MATMTRARTSSAQFIFEPLLTKSGLVLLSLFLFVLGIIYIYPFIWMVGTSFKTPAEFFSLGASVLPQGPAQWQNFVTAWDKANFGRYLVNTVIISTTTTVLIIFLTSMAAYSLSRLPLPGKKYILFGIAALFFLPKGYTILPTFRIVQGLGLLNTLWAVILVSTAAGMLFNTFLFYGYMRSIPHELEEAAIIDGANGWQRYLRVILPMSMPMIATVGLFTFMNTWNDFFTPMVFTFSRPDLRTLAVGMFAFQGETSREWTLLCAGATISIIPIIIVFIFLQRHFVDAFAGAVKN
jgi:ABC-type glycerol-3-phosphate transport system permease component